MTVVPVQDFARTVGHLLAVSVDEIFGKKLMPV